MLSLPNDLRADCTANGAAWSGLPVYSDEMAAFHRAFYPELRALMGLLPLSPEMRVLDVGCGDGFYVGLFAERLVAPGGVVGLDINPSCLQIARERVSLKQDRCSVEFLHGSLDELPLDDATCDLIWCAQSLYSLSDPVSALRRMAAAVRPGGFVAVLENDTMHQLLFPWPHRLELALRSAEMKALRDESPLSDRYYVGRRLPAVLAAAGIVPLGFHTQCIDRRAPLDVHLEKFLDKYLSRLARRVEPYLAREDAAELKELFEPRHGNYLLRQPFLTLSWLNVLAWGRRPLDGNGDDHKS